jgi:hypothetical protein
MDLLQSEWFPNWVQVCMLLLVMAHYQTCRYQSWVWLVY